MNVRTLCMFSGGITAWAAAKRIAMLEGTEGMVLLFADTLIEDEDTYRFLPEAAANVGAPLVRIADGRDPWQVFNDERFIGNSRVDPCSKELKRKLLNKWRTDNTDPAACSVVSGLNWEEPERVARFAERQAPWTVRTPLCEAPWISKRGCLDWCRAEGMEPPRMYAMGFPHANCGGFCVKAGQGTFRLLLHHFPERYAMHEAKELAAQEHIGTACTIMRDRRNKRSTPLTMKAFRERIQNGGAADCLPMGGCGCAID